MKNDSENQNGLKDKLHDGVGPHKMRKLIEDAFTKNRSDIDCKVLEQKQY